MYIIIIYIISSSCETRITRWLACGIAAKWRLQRCVLATALHQVPKLTVLLPSHGLRLQWHHPVEDNRTPLLKTLKRRHRWVAKMLNEKSTQPDLLDFKHMFLIVHEAANTRLETWHFAVARGFRAFQYLSILFLPSSHLAVDRLQHVCASSSWLGDARNCCKQSSRSRPATMATVIVLKCRVLLHSGFNVSCDAVLPASSPQLKTNTIVLAERGLQTPIKSPGSPHPVCS